ncbi:MAG: peptidase M48 [Candidatus Marinimicrobia bacterium]|nr:peptidase M48 [Candidatus Neomarinimicrobiota bacterium]|tara:strand:- start:11071 stop:12300 length:1230 start_codon:yes stop_codon:yes gene_type:complete
MNTYFIVIITILIFEYILSFIVRTLNLNALDSSLPKEFEDTFDSQKYLESQNYTRTNSSFSYITSSFSLIVSLVFIFGGIYNIIDKFVRSFGHGDVVTGLLFFAVLFIIIDVLNLPFDLYRTFVIEEKFGFNKTTFKTYFIDKFKGYFLMFILGVPLLSLILYFFGEYGDNAWIYAWVLLIMFSLVMQPMFNLFIAPMFNKFTPIEEGPLLSKIKDYLKTVNFPVKKLEIMDGSKRSSHSNAYFSGLGNNKRIALFDTLVEQMDEEEIVAVIAHEVGHYKLKHIHMGICLSAIQSGIMFFILSIFMMNSELFSVFRMENLSVYASLVFFSILYTPISMIMGFMFSSISRKNEFAADNYSYKTAKMPEKLISALKKMSKENLSNLTPHWLNVMLNYSHPPVLERIKALRK